MMLSKVGHAWYVSKIAGISLRFSSEEIGERSAPRGLRCIHVFTASLGYSCRLSSYRLAASAVASEEGGRLVSVAARRRPPILREASQGSAHTAQKLRSAGPSDS